MTKRMKIADFAARNALENLHAALHEFVRVYINQVGRRFAVFGNQNRLAALSHICEYRDCFPLKRGNQLCFHSIT